MGTGDAYQFGADRGREAGRLGAVERAFDPMTQSLLLQAGVQPGWRCWEVGAGNGSIARWLAHLVGREGSVLATDLEGQRFDAGDTDVAFLRHDVLADPPPGEGFDLVHARFLLEHLADPRLAIDRFRDALRPGGMVVLEDSAGLQIELTPSLPVFEQLAFAWEEAGHVVGWDAGYGRRLAADLRAAEMSDLHGYQYRQVALGGASWEHLGQGLERLRDELIERGIARDELRHALDCLADPSFLITGPPVTVMWGRR